MLRSPFCPAAVTRCVCTRGPSSQQRPLARGAGPRRGQGRRRTLGDEPAASVPPSRSTLITRTLPTIPAHATRLKDGNGADSSKSQSVAELWPRPANLRRESCDCAQLRNFRSHMNSSVEILDLAGISIHLPIFSDLPTPPTRLDLVHPTTCPTKTSHADPKIAQVA
jgi:hypothetical protein